jgi:hypothetical protein
MMMNLLAAVRYWSSPHPSRSVMVGHVSALDVFDRYSTAEQDCNARP